MKTKQAQRKEAQRAALRARLESAQRDMYGNARTPWSDDVDGFRSFGDWLGDYAEREHEYMTRDNFGRSLRETQTPAMLSAWSRRWPTASRRLADARRANPTPRYASQVRDAARINFAFPAGEWERDNAVLSLDAHDRLTKPRRDGVGRENAVYSAGRNGKTVYPTFAATDRQGFIYRDLSENTAEELTRACQFIEQFNAYVRVVAKAAPSVYADEARDALQESISEAHNKIKEARAGYRTLADELRKLRGTDAPTACGILRDRLHTLARAVRVNARDIHAMRETLKELHA